VFVFVFGLLFASLLRSSTIASLLFTFALLKFSTASALFYQ
jgi:hypothetical protein